MANWLALGKPQSKFGKCLTRYGITDLALEKESGIGRNTIGRARKNDNFTGNSGTKVTLVRTLNRMTGQEFSVEDFWV